MDNPTLIALPTYRDNISYIVRPKVDADGLAGQIVNCKRGCSEASDVDVLGPCLPNDGLSADIH